MGLGLFSTKYLAVSCRAAWLQARERENEMKAVFQMSSNSAARVVRSISGQSEQLAFEGFICVKLSFHYADVVQKKNTDAQP